MRDNESTFEAIKDLPVIGICGFSGSGKTTLIEALLPWLLKKKLKVAVVKHDVHGIDVDRPGKDSDRFFQAGADVYLQGQEQLIRKHIATEINLPGQLLNLICEYDMILVEGHKHLPLPKIWLLNEEEDKPPDNICGIQKVFARDSKRVQRFMDFIQNWLPEQWLKAPIAGCIRSGSNFIEQNRLAQIKIQLQEVTRGIMIMGKDEVTGGDADRKFLPKIFPFQGPLAAILTVMRQHPHMCWLMVDSTDDFSGSDLKLLLSRRVPGKWLILAKGTESSKSVVSPIYFDFRSHGLLENLFIQNNDIGDIMFHPRVQTVTLSKKC